MAAACPTDTQTNQLRTHNGKGPTGQQINGTKELYIYIYIYIYHVSYFIFSYYILCDVYMYICIYVYMYICVCLCVYMYLCIYMYMYICIYIYIYMYICMCEGIVLFRRHLLHYFAKLTRRLWHESVAYIQTTTLSISHLPALVSRHCASVR